MNARVSKGLVVALAMTAATGTARVSWAGVFDKFSTKGASAFVGFSSTVPLTCPDGSAGELLTQIFLNGSEFLTRSTTFPHDAGNVVSADVFQFDSCTQASFSSFSAANGIFTAPDKMSLDLAIMRGTIQVTDFSNGNLIPLVVDVSVVGTGSVSTGKFHSKYTFEGPEGPITVISKSDGRSREGTASGTLTFNGVDLTGSFFFANLSSNKSAFIEIKK